MRLLVISNLFPPHVLGGYEIVCAQVCEELARRGHRITVLTSDHGVTGQERDDPYPVHRRLQIYQPFGETGRLLRGRRLQVGRRSHRITRELIASERPEQIFVWSLLRLTLGPARAALESSIPTAFTFNDENIAGYLPVPFAPTPRRLLGWLADRVAIPQITLRGLQLSRSTCISAQLKSKLVAAGVPVDSSRVIYQGIPIERFPLKSPRPFSRPAKVLFTGQLVPMKGIPTLIEGIRPTTRVPRRAEQRLQPQA